MGVLEVASGKSRWRGFEYAESHRVKSLNKVGDLEFDAEVRGSSDTLYHVHLDVEHPRKSSCDCPHAKGRRIICKHIVATYFEAFPQQAKAYYKAVVEWEREEEARREREELALDRYLEKSTKSELIGMVYELLADAPDWAYERFLRDHGLDERYE